MESRFLSFVTTALVAVSLNAFADSVQEKVTAAGKQYGTSTSQAIGFHGAVPTGQRSAAAQTVLTDSTGGSTSNVTLADGLTATAPAALTATAPAAATVGSDIAAFTDPPSAGEMAALRTFVNALKADNADLRTKLAAAVVDLAALRTPLAAAVTDDSTQNDNDAKIAKLLNELQAALVAKGFIKGSN